MSTANLNIGSENQAALDHTAQHAALFKALADPRRLEILALLRGAAALGACGNPDCTSGGKASSGEADRMLCACDLVDITGLSQPTVSHHMRLLVAAGLVTAHKRGRWTHYALDTTGFAVAREVLDALAPV